MSFQHYDIDFNEPEQAARTMIRAARDSLISCRGKSPNPEELEWEVRVYDFMLKDPITRWAQYQEARHAGPGVLIPKRKAVARLGWEIP